MKVKVVGAGLAGSEAAFYLANRGVKVTLYDVMYLSRNSLLSSSM